MTLAKAGRWSSLSRGRKITVALVLIVALLAAALWIASIALRPRYPTPAEITASAKAQAALTGGASVFATHCAYCHTTGFAPALGGRDLPAEAVQSFVRTGPGAMPAFPPSQVSDADIVAMAAYLKQQPAAPDETAK